MRRAQNVKVGMVLLGVLFPLCVTSGQAEAEHPCEISVGGALETFRTVDRLPRPDNPILRRGASYSVLRGPHVPYGTLRFAATTLRVQNLKDCLELMTYLRDRDGHIRYIAANALMNALGIVINREDAPRYGLAMDMASDSYSEALSVLLDKIASRVGRDHLLQNDGIGLEGNRVNEESGSDLEE